MFAKPKYMTLLLCNALLILGPAGMVHAYESKDSVLADALLAELLNRMDNDMQVGYYDVDSEGAAAALPLDKNAADSVDLAARADYPNLCGDVDASSNNDCLLQAAAPVLRDQEYMQHSSLWGHQFVPSGSLSEVPNRYDNMVKNEASLPAYCNPPNPCPEGYELDLPGGCIADFENTAIFSREFQAAQDCTCDSEHMFDCADQESAAAGNRDMNSAVEKFLMHQFQHNENNANSVVKKAFKADSRIQALINPFLQGDRLPIAAKKGNLLFN